MSLQTVDETAKLAATLGLATSEEMPADEDVEEPQEDATDMMADEADVEGEDYLDEEDEGGVSLALDLNKSFVADGDEFKVESVDEATKLIQLGKTFTSRNNRLIQERQQFEESLKPLKAELEQKVSLYSQALPQIEQMFDRLAGDEPTPDQFQDWQQYEIAKREWSQIKQVVQDARTEQQRIASEQAEAQRERFSEWVSEQQALTLKRIPEWKDEEVAKREAGQIMDYLQTRGVDVAQLQRTNPAILMDAGFTAIARDAWRFHQLDTKGKEVVKTGPKTAAPGQGERPKTGKNRKRAKQMERLRQTGSERDAVPLLADMLGITS